MGPKDGTRLGDVLVRAGADADAVSEGRVFVGKRRASSMEVPVRPGDEVHIAAPQGGPDDLAPATILAEEGGIVAADKPADLVTTPDHGGATASLLASVARALGTEARSLHPTSRLDRGVSGVVIFARTASSAERLRLARVEGTYARRYVAIASALPEPARGEWDAPIGRAKDPRHRAAHGPEGAPALSRYAVVATTGTWSLLALEPVTGRTHQLRVHAAHAGAPLLGDRVYGGPSRVTLQSGRVLSFTRIGLHAARVRVPRADRGTMEVSSPIPAELLASWRALGGEDAAWEAALTEIFTPHP